MTQNDENAAFDCFVRLWGLWHPSGDMTRWMRALDNAQDPMTPEEADLCRAAYERAQQLWPESGGGHGPSVRRPTPPRHGRDES